MIRRGRPRNLKIKFAIPVILKALGIATPERIRKEFHRLYGESVAWVTVNRCLRELVSVGSLSEIVLSKRDAVRNVRVYRLR